MAIAAASSAFAVTRIAARRACSSQTTSSAMRDEDADRDANRRLQPAVVDRVPEEEHRGEHERDAGDRREQLHADELFPVERLSTAAACAAADGRHRRPWHRRRSIRRRSGYLGLRRVRRLWRRRWRRLDGVGVHRHLFHWKRSGHRRRHDGMLRLDDRLRLRFDDRLSLRLDDGLALFADPPFQRVDRRALIFDDRPRGGRRDCAAVVARHRTAREGRTARQRRHNTRRIIRGSIRPGSAQVDERHSRRSRAGESARRSTLPVPSVGIDSTKCRSSRLGSQSRGSSVWHSRSQRSWASTPDRCRTPPAARLCASSGTDVTTQTCTCLR